MKKLYLLSLLLLFCFAVSAQSKWKVTGTVSDTQGQPLIGATVQIKGTSTGTSTDAKGKYAIEVTPNSTLEFKYLGYESLQKSVSSQTVIDAVMSYQENRLDEVVVTALGIKRDRKALGYSIGEVKGEELEKAKETNVINSLAGKIPGLVISQTAGGPSGSTRVMIRGNTELTGNNQPLYVVDGVPLDNTNFAAADQNGGYDLGDGISAINADDIENISVLKGPAASALYGSRASHGVILITTKKATGKKGIGVEFNSTTTIDQQLTKYNNLQTIYGQGSEGRISGVDDKHSSSKSWGPRIDPGLYMTYFDGVRRPYELVENNIDNFFRTGVTTTNTLILSSVKESVSTRLSYTNMINTDIVPNTDMQRNSINLRSTAKIAGKIDVDVKVNYVREDVNNRPALGGDKNNIGKNLITLANTFDQRLLAENYINSQGNYYDWNNLDPYNMNPYWIINEMNNLSGKDKFSGTVALNYKINDKFSFRVTGGGDINILNFQDYAPVSTPGRETGFLQRSNFLNKTYNVEALFSYKQRFGKWDVGANVGGNVFGVNNRTDVITAKDMRMREVVALQSFLSKENKENIYRKQINSLFGMVNIGYNDFLFLDATVRADKSSTLPSNKNTYVYPSASVSFVLSEVWGVDKKTIPYAKFRASVAQVGSDTEPYRLDLMYSMIDKQYDLYSIGAINNGDIPNRNLKPTRTNSMEFGLDMKFLNNRLGFDFTYYSQESRDQIMRLNTSSASGYNAKIVNAGAIQNRGIEVAISTRPIQTKDFRWDVNFNFAKNANKVKSLANNLDRFTMASATWLDVTVDAVVGQNYGAIMGKDFLRNGSGYIIIDPATGYPKITDNPVLLGNATWDWTGGLSTVLAYKNLSLSAIFDIKVGADIYSMSARSFIASGKANETLPGRDEWYRSEEQRLAAGSTATQWRPTGGYIANGVIENIDEDGNKTYRPNDICLSPEVYWSYIATTVPSAFVYDNTYVKVRELTLSYKLPRKWISKFAQDISLAFVARNPFIIYKNIPNIDPDSNYNNTTGMGLELGSLPSRRSFGFNINVKF